MGQLQVEGADGPKIVCEICSATIRGEQHFFGGQRVCAECAAEQRAKASALGGVAGSPGEDGSLARAGLLGLAAALVAGGLWALVVVLTDHEIGYLAVGVGALAGFAVKVGSRSGEGKRLQQLAVACSVVGLLAAKYFIFAHFITTAAAEEGVELGYLSLGTMATFPRALGELLSFYDLLWLFFAVSAAWRITAPQTAT